MISPVSPLNLHSLLSACEVGQTKRLSGLYLSEESSSTCARAAKPCAPWPQRDTLDNSHTSWGSLRLRRIAHPRPAPGAGQHIVMTDLVCQRGWLLIFFPFSFYLDSLEGKIHGGSLKQKKKKKISHCARRRVVFCPRCWWIGAVRFPRGVCVCFYFSQL